MNNYLKLPFYVMGYKLFRSMEWPRLLPISLTLSVTNKCDSRCKTCNIWKQKPKKELSLLEWKKILKSVGKNPIWFTISGGEPFLNGDLSEIVRYICEFNKPFIINIATNGLNSKEIETAIKKITKTCDKHKVKLIINVSIDEIDGRYDSLRGTTLGFKKVLKSLQILRQIQERANLLKIGINITVSKYNVQRFDKIYNYITKQIKPNSIISEMATNRKVFYLTNQKISPKKSVYLKVLNTLINSRTTQREFLTSLIFRLRRKYYRLIKDHILFGKRMPCYAGVATAEISCTGEVMNCCTLAESFGNLRKAQYDIRKIWVSKTALQIRRKIKRKKCFCTLSNSYYTNFICGL